MGSSALINKIANSLGHGNFTILKKNPGKN